MEKIKKMNITDYSVIFQLNNKNNYEMEMDKVVEFLSNYAYNDFVGNSNELCYLIKLLATECDLIEIIRVLKEFNEEIANKYEFYCIDFCTYKLSCFSDLKQLNKIFNLYDIITDIVEMGRLEEYANKIDG